MRVRMSIFSSIDGIADRRRLQAVAQRLVIQQRDGPGAGGVVIPVVDQRVRRDGHRITSVRENRRPADAVAVQKARRTAGRIQSSIRA